MQPTPPPKVYPQDAACALLQSLFITIKSLGDLHTLHDRTQTLVKKLEQELRDMPEEDYFVTDRQQCGQHLREAQELSRSQEKKVEDASHFIGMCLSCDMRSSMTLAGDVKSVMYNNENNCSNYQKILNV